MSLLVYIEKPDGKFRKQSFELASYAGEMAKLLTIEAIAITIGNTEDGELLKLSDYGISKIIRHDTPDTVNFNPQIYTHLISETVTKTSASVIIFPHNTNGKALAPRLSAKLKAGISTATVGLPVAMEPFTLKRKVFTGKAFTEMIISTDIKIITLAPNTHEIKEEKAEAIIEDFNPEIPEKYLQMKVLEVNKATDKIILTEADIVVSGGRGMKGSENWSVIEDLAKELGAATACSRPVSDEGWRDHSEHVGQTGKVIAPNLYFAAGISGAIQHMAGVNSSKCIVAINKDPEAPVFEMADYGIVGDVMTILPEITKAVKIFKSN